jgi:hypothetical protein
MRTVFADSFYFFALENDQDPAHTRAVAFLQAYRGGILVTDEPVIVFCYVPDAALTVDALAELYNTLSRMGREGRQGEVGVVIDGKYYGITDYQAE